MKSTRRVDSRSVPVVGLLLIGGLIMLFNKNFKTFPYLFVAPDDTKRGLAHSLGRCRMAGVRLFVDHVELSPDGNRSLSGWRFFRNLPFIRTRGFSSEQIGFLAINSSRSSPQNTGPLLKDGDQVACENRSICKSRQVAVGLITG